MMRFQSLTQAMVLLTATLVSSIHVPENLVDGTWTGIEYANGTTVTTCLSDLTLAPIIEHHEPTVRSLETRGSGTGGCWGYTLDSGSVDADNQALQSQFSGGAEYCSGNSNSWTGKVENSVIVYFCADNSNECFYLDAAIIATGMGLMDAICKPYEAGWALYPNTGSNRFILGKCVVNSNICV